MLVLLFVVAPSIVSARPGVSDGDKHTECCAAGSQQPGAGLAGTDGLASASDRRTRQSERCTGDGTFLYQNQRILVSSVTGDQQVWIVGPAASRFCASTAGPDHGSW